MKRATEERAQAILTDYRNAVPIFEIQARHHCSSRSIYTLLDRYGVPRRPDERPWRRRSVNENFFDVLTPDSAWVLGLWLTDGSIDQRGTSKRALIGFADEDLLRTVHRLMDTSAKITQSPTRGNRIGFWSFRCTNTHLCNRLAELGVTQPKETRGSVPSVAPVGLHHLVRGIFDGDGHISESVFPGFAPYCNAQIAYPNRYFLFELSRLLFSLLNINTRVVAGDGCWQLRMRHHSAITFLRWLYQESEGRRLERKYQRALPFLQST